MGGARQIGVRLKCWSVTKSFIVSARVLGHYEEKYRTRRPHFSSRQAHAEYYLSPTPSAHTLSLSPILLELPNLPHLELGSTSLLLLPLSHHHHHPNITPLLELL
jgi:hypothetical protein